VVISHYYCVVGARRVQQIDKEGPKENPQKTQDNEWILVPTSQPFHDSNQVIEGWWHSEINERKKH
jgi:hypothetical protein